VTQTSEDALLLGRAGRNNDFAASEQAAVDRECARAEQSNTNGGDEHQRGDKEDAERCDGRGRKPGESDGEDAQSHHQARERGHESDNQAESAEEHNSRDTPHQDGAVAYAGEVQGAKQDGDTAQGGAQQKQANTGPATGKGGK